jgi:DNA-binding MarR family transcriptional regulator
VTKHQIDYRNLTQRLHQHFFIDGVVEGLAGLWLIMLGGYFLVTLNMERTLFFVYPLLMIALPLLLGPVTQAIKANISAPRVGYAKLPPPPEQEKRLRIAAALTGVGILLAIILDLFGSPRSGGGLPATGWLQLLPLLIGIPAAAGFFYTAVRHAITRFYPLSILILLTGALTAALAPTPFPGIILFMLLAGTLLLLQRAAHLRCLPAPLPRSENRTGWVLSMDDANLHKLAELDRLVHEPARLLILAYLSIVAEADFLFLLHETGLTRGNLSSHLSKLEDAGYVEIKKGYIGRKPHTLCKLTAAGKAALQAYRQMLKQALDL